MLVEYLEHMGDDRMVVNAAFVSNDNWITESMWREGYALSSGKFLSHQEVVNRAQRLILKLAGDDHWTPFAHPQIQFRIVAPIFVANQLKRHSVGAAINEVSRRYVNTDPNFEKLIYRRKSNTMKQGSAGPVPMEVQLYLEKEAKEIEEEATRLYKKWIKQGIASELARTILPQTMQTSWIWTASLYFYFRLCQRRLHAHAQSETREVAILISNKLRELFPISWEALMAQGLKS